ncbi:hypothetical protein BD410DRAFT_810418, partial [Rickenella mellea]
RSPAQRPAASPRASSANPSAHPSMQLSSQQLSSQSAAAPGIHSSARNLRSRKEPSPIAGPSSQRLPAASPELEHWTTFVAKLSRNAYGLLSKYRPLDKEWFGGFPTYDEAVPSLLEMQAAFADPSNREKVFSAIPFADGAAFKGIKLACGTISRTPAVLSDCHGTGVNIPWADLEKCALETEEEREKLTESAKSQKKGKGKGTAKK